MKKKTKPRVRQQTTDFTARFMMWMAASILAFTFLYIFAITFVEVPESNQRFADTIIGFLVGTLAGTVINYFYGSSKNSSEKNKYFEALTMLQGKINEAVDESRVVFEGDEENQEEEPASDPAEIEHDDFDARMMGTQAPAAEDELANDSDLEKANSQ